MGLVWLGGAAFCLGAASHAAAQPCIGDCDGDGAVQINELVLGVAIALGARDLSACPNLDDGEGRVPIDRLVAAVNNALCGCQSCSGAASPTPTATMATPAMTPTATPTGAVSVSMWTVDDYTVTSSDCAGALEDAVLRAVQALGSDFTVRESDMDVEIEDENGNTYHGTVDPDGTIHVRQSTGDSIATCDYDVAVDASANLSQSPTTATYDADVNLSGFCLGLNDCSMQVTARWRRVEG